MALLPKPSGGQQVGGFLFGPADRIQIYPVKSAHLRYNFELPTFDKQRLPVSSLMNTGSKTRKPDEPTTTLA